MAELGAAGRPRTVALLGGGVIGGGWAARFLLNGCDVRLYDPAPGAARAVGEVLGNARRAYGRLTHVPLPREGVLTLVATPEEGVDGADFVQESAPEREPLKRDLLATASRAAPPGTVIASSTSGLRPSRLQADMTGPERLCVGHPFNPVYLLPLVEVCGGAATAPETLARAAAVYESVGMRPLTVRREVDAFVADRLLEALWRGALWLGGRGVATLGGGDDALPLRAGPRRGGSAAATRSGGGVGGGGWAPSRRSGIAGGGGGRPPSPPQLGRALQPRGGRLTEVPPLTAELVDKLAAQSDAQAAGRSTRELER